MKNVSLVSIASGFRDTLIRSDCSIVEDILPATNAFTVYAYEIPNVRVSADHLVSLVVQCCNIIFQSITWCKQLIYTIGNAVLSLVNDPDNSVRKYDLDLRTRMEVLHTHFRSNSKYYFGVVGSEQTPIETNTVNVTYPKALEMKKLSHFWENVPPSRTFKFDINEM